MTRVIDLTLTLREGMRGVAFETVCTIEKEGWNARNLHLYSHAGTHMDAQTHFAAGPGTIDQIALARCIRPAWMVRLQNLRPRQEICVSDLGAIAQRFQAGDALLLQTGWSRHCDDPKLYRDELPRVSDELADWCVSNKAGLIGVEPPSVADVHNRAEVTRIHQKLLGGGVIIVEGLTNLDQVRAERVIFGALPLKVHGGDGAPCRAFAIEGVPPDSFS